MMYIAAIAVVTVGVALGNLLAKVVSDWMNKREWKRIEAKAATERAAARVMFSDMQDQVERRAAEDRIKAAIDQVRRSRQN